MTGGQPSSEGTRQPQPGGRVRTLLTVRLVVVCLVALYAILFVVMNTHSAKIDFVFTSTDVSVIWVILLSLVLGAALAVLGQQLRRRRQRKR